MTMELKLDVLHNSIEFVSRIPPELHVNRVLFSLPSEENKSWPPRFGHVYLKYHCKVLDYLKPGQQAASTIDRTNLSVSPMHMQPVFDLAEHWRFEAPIPFNPVRHPEWQVQLTLEGFTFSPDEMVKILLTTNMQPVGEVAY